MFVTAAVALQPGQSRGRPAAAAAAAAATTAHATVIVIIARGCGTGKRKEQEMVNDWSSYGVAGWYQLVMQPCKVHLTISLVSSVPKTATLVLFRTFCPSPATVRADLVVLIRRTWRAPGFVNSLTRRRRPSPHWTRTCNHCLIASQ